MIAALIFIILGTSGSIVADKTILADPDASNEVIDGEITITDETDLEEPVKKVKKSKQSHNRKGPRHG